MNTQVSFQHLSLLRVPFEQCYRSDLCLMAHFNEITVAKIAQETKAGELPQAVYARMHEGKFEVIIGWELLFWAHTHHKSRDHWPIYVVQESMEVCLFEIIAQAKLQQINVIDIAHTLKTAIYHYAMTKQQVVTALKGLYSPITINHFLRLLKLHPDVQDMMRAGKISYSQGRQLTSSSLDRQLELAHAIVVQQLSNSQLKTLIRGNHKEVTTVKSSQHSLSTLDSPQPPVDQDVLAYVTHIEEKVGYTCGFNTPFTARQSLSFPFNSLTALDAITDTFTQPHARPNFSASVTLNIADRETLQALVNALKSLPLKRGGRLDFYYDNHGQLGELIDPLLGLKE